MDKGQRVEYHNHIGSCGCRLRHNSEPNQAQEERQGRLFGVLRGLRDGVQGNEE
jgi:hypothetical protein